jgi:hypothetical protein
MTDAHPILTASLTTLFAAVVGFVVGMLADILKSRINDSHKRKGIRRAIYEELAAIWGMFDGMIQARPNPNQQEAEVLMKAIMTVGVDAYKQAMTDPALFYGLKEASTLQTLYTKLNILKQSSVLPNVALMNYQDMKEWRDEIAQAVETNVLDRTVFSPAYIPLSHEQQ